MVKDSLDKRVRKIWNPWMLCITPEYTYINQGWQQLPFEYQFSSRFGLKWVERRSQIDYRSHVSGQLVCHIPNNDCICTKIGLLATLRVPMLTETHFISESCAVLNCISLGIFLQAINPRSRGEEKYSVDAWDIRPGQSCGLCRVDRRGN